jgi:hypothetical protein
MVARGMQVNRLNAGQNSIRINSTSLQAEQCKWSRWHTITEQKTLVWQAPCRHGL